jgi:hypothetical protein
MEKAIVTKGHLISTRNIELEEDIPFNDETYEIILKPISQKSNNKRKAGTLKGLIHIKDDFDEPLEDFQEYMK